MPTETPIPKSRFATCKDLQVVNHHSRMPIGEIGVLVNGNGLSGMLVDRAVNREAFLKIFDFKFLKNRRGLL